MTRASELTRLLSISANFRDGEERGHINGQQHGLRVAALAKRYDSTDDEMIFTALVHDLARPLNDVFHGEVIAEMVRDLISEDRYQVLRTHGLYQAAYAFEMDFELDTTAPYHKDAMHLYGWELASFAEWNRSAMDLSEAIWYIEKFCGDRR